jgi:DNA-binding response OmpR family regulator
MGMKIVVVDDEEKMTGMISDYLSALDYEVLTAENGLKALAAVRSEQPDCIILDVMMPELDGLDVLRRLRQFSQIPVIMLTAKSQEADKLMGLELGADDYMVKPFSLKELEARIRAVLRRTRNGAGKTQEGRGKTITYLDIAVDPVKMTLKRGGEEVTLTSAQFRICTALFSNPGRVFSRMDLLRSVQEAGFEGYERTIDVHIKNIRKVLETDPSNPEYIMTVWGAGYKVPEVEKAGHKAPDVRDGGPEESV